MRQHDDTALRGAARPERQARPQADDSAFAGPRSSAPAASEGASGSGRAALHSGAGIVVGMQHRTRGRCGCQSNFSLSPFFSLSCLRFPSCIDSPCQFSTLDAVVLTLTQLLHDSKTPCTHRLSAVMTSGHKVGQNHRWKNRPGHHGDARMPCCCSCNDKTREGAQGKCRATPFVSGVRRDWR